MPQATFHVVVIDDAILITFPEPTNAMKMTAGEARKFVEILSNAVKAMMPPPSGSKRQ